MKKIIHSIFDAFEFKEKEGFSIVGTNSELDDCPIDFFKTFKDKEIVIKNPDGTIVTGKVIDVTASSSIMGRKNIAFLLPIDLKGQVQLKASVWGEW
jgi:hypothetical protein